MKATKPSEMTANERLKARSADRTKIGILIAVALHFGLFGFIRPFHAAELGSSVDEITAIALPPEVRIPPPPEQIARPATPRVSAVTVSEEITIAPTTFATNPVESLPPPRPSGTRKADQPSFIPYDTPPVLLNGPHIQQLLMLYYPRSLRAAGIEGRVELWLYVDEAGAVQTHQVMTSSGIELLDLAAGRVAGEMRFSPAKNRDKVTAVWVQQLVTFLVK